MGALLSALASDLEKPSPPPQVVLVPPMFERDLRERAR